MAPRLAVSPPPLPPLLLLLLLLAGALPAAAAHSVPVQASFLEDMGGSGEADDASASSPSLPPPRTPALSATSSAGPEPTPLAGPKPPTNLLDGIVDFFREYALLIAVVGSLVLLAMFIVCAAVITRQKHKASAYYPSSFPRKKYVDQRDRAGGPQAFSEVPDRPPAAGRPEEPLDSSQQLQADILAATQNLRSPARGGPSGGDGGARVTAEGRPEGEQAEDRDAPGRGVPAEKPGVTEEPCSGPAEGAPGAGESPEAAPSSAQEAGDPAGAPQSPCAYGSVTPSV